MNGCLRQEIEGALAALPVEAGGRDDPLIRSPRLVSSESTRVESELTAKGCKASESKKKSFSRAGPGEKQGATRTPRQHIGGERVEAGFEVVQEGVDL